MARIDSDLLYNKIVHFYMDKKGYARDKANSIAQSVIRRETGRGTCKDVRCGHGADRHIGESETCLVPECACKRFVRT